MSTITARTEVDRPAEQVFAYATDPSRFSEWQRGVVDGHIDESGTASVGARCVTTRRIGFANRPITSEVRHIDPPKTWGVRGIDGPGRTRVELEHRHLERFDDPDAARASLGSDGGWPGLLARLRAQSR